MQATCRNCNSNFELDAQQEAHLKTCAAQGMTRMVLECSNCFESTEVDPTHPVEELLDDDDE